MVFFNRPTHLNGHVLRWKNTRTGKVLLRKELFREGRKWFDPAFGSGGEDRDFFRRKIEEGHVFVWSNEDPVFETIPPARWKRKILFKRALVRGKMALNTIESKPVSVFNSLVVIVIYTCGLPLAFIMGHHVFMKYLIKNCDHLGKVIGFLGIEWAKKSM